MKNYVKAAILLCAGLLVISAANAQSTDQNPTYVEYIRHYAPLAMKLQKEYGVPASIKLAQGLLESGSGLSVLSTEANNHFGIKCKTWSGEKIYKTDDAPDECFRKYPSVEASYIDHSQFLRSGARYADLFALDVTDYKGWATGLKRAGYATAPQYAQRLISIIEIYELDAFDRGEMPSYMAFESSTQTNTSTDSSSTLPSTQSNENRIDVDNYQVQVHKSGGYWLHTNNGIHYVIARDGDTFQSIAKAFSTTTMRIRRMNDIARGDTKLDAGDIVYVESKASRYMQPNMIYTVSGDESARGIAQQYGITLRSLCRMNGCGGDKVFATGVEVRLSK